MEQEWTQQYHLGNCFNLTLEKDKLPENIPIRLESEAGYSDDFQARVCIIHLG
jgi:hypothetical protein